jgi:hypothetical protein
VAGRTDGRSEMHDFRSLRHQRASSQRLFAGTWLLRSSFPLSELLSCVVAVTGPAKEREGISCLCFGALKAVSRALCVAGRTEGGVGSGMLRGVRFRRLRCDTRHAARGTRHAARRQPTVARMLPIGPGGLQSGFSILRYVRRDFRKKNRVRGLPAPPVAPRSWVP